jgi:tRNA G18 (ribose-2'-O)-methylase SpoU
VLDGLKPDFNVGKIFRSAHAFGVHEIHLVKIPFFNPNPALGTLKTTRILEFSTMEESLTELRSRGYTLYALDGRGPVQLGKVSFPKKSAFILGHEEFGLSFSLQHYGDVMALSIPQFGVVQSLNVSVAASLVSFEYLRQHHL